MNDMFIANMMMQFSAQQHMIQHQNAHLLNNHHKAFSYNNMKASSKIFHLVAGFNRDYHYAGIEQEPVSLFDNVEIIDIPSGMLHCYMKVDIIDENSIIIRCEIRKGYMHEEDIVDLLHKQILTAIGNGYINICAITGKNDEVAYDILLKMGFIQ